MASTLTVSSLFSSSSSPSSNFRSSSTSSSHPYPHHSHPLLPHSEFPSRAQPLALFPHLRCFAHNPRAPAAVATPNSSSILSDDAFRGFLSDEDEEEKRSESSYGEGEVENGEAVSNDDELLIDKLGLPEPLVDSLHKRGITHLFPIQRSVLAPALEGQDIIARAKTGTGKTLAFGIPIIKKLTIDDEGRNIHRVRGRLPRVLVLAPTRELARQVEKEIKESASYLNTVCVYGGVSYVTQQNALSRGVDVVVGTPGRIIDLINGGSLQLSEVQYLVLDEADQMLAVGFEEDVEVILKTLPTEHQSMLFSATMPGWVKKLSRKYLKSPLTIDLVGDEEEKLAEGIQLYAVRANASSKRSILGDLITVYAKGGKTIVFTQRKKDADEVSTALTNSITSEALHGDISQYQRERTLNRFRQGKFTVLVATDVAARGLDIPNVDLIIHYELPNDPETFVHRSGRTGRAGKEGSAVLLFTNNQRRTVRSLERDVGCRFEFISPPQIEQVLQSSADQVISTLDGVHPESIKYFLPTAEKLTEEKGNEVLAAALAQLSGFSQPPSSRSLISHEPGWLTLQLIRESVGRFSRGLSTRGVMGFLSDVYSTAADEVGKIHLIADDRVQGAVFDLPEEIARELMAKELPPGNSITKISKLPELQDDGPRGDYYGRFSNSDRGSRRSSRGGFRDDGFRRDGRSSRYDFNDNDGFGRGRGGRSSRYDSNDNDFRRGGRRGGFRRNDSWSSDSQDGGDDRSMGGRRSNRSSSSSRKGRSFGGGRSRTGNRSSDWLDDGDF